MQRGRFILLGNGSYYSIAVLGHLLETGVTPVALVMPRYPPAAINQNTQIRVDAQLGKHAFADMADRLSIPIIYAPRAAQPSLPDQLSMFDAEYMLVACWPYLLSPAVLTVVNQAALNLHPSLLPEYQGPDPVAQQLVCNETKLGVSLHRLSQQFDSGEIVRRAGFELDGTASGRRQIETQAARMGSELFIDVLKYGIYPSSQEYR